MTQNQRERCIIPVVITVYADRSFTFITQRCEHPYCSNKAAKIAKGANDPKREKVGTVTAKQVQEIAELKFNDLNAVNIEGAVKIIAGTARSMGIEIAG